MPGNGRSASRYVSLEDRVQKRKRLQLELDLALSHVAIAWDRMRVHADEPVYVTALHARVGELVLAARLWYGDRLENHDDDDERERRFGLHRGGRAG